MSKSQKFAPSLPSTLRSWMGKTVDANGQQHASDGKFGSGGGSKKESSHSTHGSTGGLNDSSKEYENKAKGLFSTLRKLGSKVSAAGKAVANVASGVAAFAVNQALSINVADVLETPEDAAKICNDRAVNAQISDALGIPLNTAVQSVVTKILAYGMCKVKQAMSRKSGTTKHWSGKSASKDEIFESKAKIMKKLFDEFLPKLGVTPENIPSLETIKERMGGKNESNQKILSKDISTARVDAMPKVETGEAREHYIGRCIPYVMNEGKTDNSSQAAAICHSLFNKHQTNSRHQKKDNPLPGSVDHLTLDGPVGKPELDLAKMCARFIFATDGLDRVGDVLNINGIDTANHRKNPVVLFDHAKWFGDPIGKTVDPLGNYTVEFTEHEAYQTTYFLDTKLGHQYFALVEMGGLNCNSLGYQPRKKRKNNAGGYFLDEVELVEISIVTVPANGECIRAFLSRDKICGSAIDPILVKALSPYAVPRKTTVSVNGNRSYLMSKVIEKKAMEADTGKPAPVAAKVEAAPAEAQVTPLPHGAEMLHMVHQHFKDILDYCEENLPKLESDEVEAALLNVCNMIFDHGAKIEKKYDELYPDHDPLVKIDETHGKMDEKDDEGMEEKDGSAISGDSVEGNPANGEVEGKSYSSDIKRLTKAMGGTIKECADHLDDMKDHENLNPQQKLVCKYYAKELGSMVEEKATEVDPGPVDEHDTDNEEIEREYDALTESEKKAFEAELQILVSQQDAAERRRLLVELQ